ncbi:MAG: endonuclease/exonuclease/phosphatase family protein [Clostridia bacterium]|nr:endonuclease/exonuclease/phosphatase family protein [Clostridia bacterium]
MKKVLSVVLALMFILGTGSVLAFADNADTGEFTAFCQNVAGLPDISFVFGDDRTDVKGNQAVIGGYVEAESYDIFASQEDFGYHDTLVSALPSYKYRTAHHGGVPYGDGTNIFTRSFPLYNEKHVPWDKLYGIADDGADELSKKGITYACIKVADNVYVDFYNIHADAYGDAGSVAARQDNFRQLAELINSRDIDRPVIVTGDFNAFLFNDNSLLKETLVDGCGLKDAWVEVKNNGDYDDCSYYINTVGGVWTDKWGVWDSVERFMYKDGGGVTLTPTEFSYVTVKTDDGKAVSDHNGVHVKFAYDATNASANIGDGTQVVKTSAFSEFFRRIRDFFKALFLALSNLDKVIDYFSE